MSATILPMTQRVLDYLRDFYGIRDATAAHGGNHPYVTFWYNGKRVRITINPNLLNWGLKRQDIHRLLGAPPTALPPKERRTLMEMTATMEKEAAAMTSPTILPQEGWKPNVLLAPPPTTTVLSEDFLLANVRIGVYQSDSRRSFERSIHVTFLGNSIKHIFQGLDDYARFDYAVDNNCLRLWLSKESGRVGWTQITQASARVVIHSNGALEVSRSQAVTAAEMVGSELRLTLAPAQPLMANRQPAAKRPAPTKAMPTPARVAEPPKPPELAPTPVEPPTRTRGPRSALADDLRACLALVAELEGRSAYRLTRVRATDGTETWEWRAPTIRL